MAQVANIAALIVMLAMLATLVKSRNSASIISSFGHVFTGSLTAAEQG